MHVGDSSYGKVTVIPFVAHCANVDSKQTRFISDPVDTDDTSIPDCVLPVHTYVRYRASNARYIESNYFSTDKAKH